MTAHFHTSDGLRLAYDETGRGPPVLCLSGLTRNMADFDTVVARFADTARFIRMDYRGRGASEFAPDSSSYTIAQEAQDALALLDHLALPKAAILGTSRGGLIAMALASTAPERLTGALLNDIGPEVAPAGIDAILDYLGRPPTYRTHAEAAAGLASALAPAFRNVPQDTWLTHAMRLFRATPDGLALSYDPRLRDAIVNTGASGPLPTLWPQFDALAALGPIALIRGANSNLLSAQTATEMRARAPHMLYAEIPDRGHVPFLDEPDAETAIAAFLARLPPP